MDDRGIPTPEVPFSNGTEQEAWSAAWCDHCVHDHGIHADAADAPACELFYAGAMLAGTEGWRWPEAWLPEPDDGRFFLPSRMICGQFQPCDKGDCIGDDLAEERAERVAEVTAYWRSGTGSAP